MMNEQNLELLKQTKLPENLYEYCYIKDGIIFPPRIEKDGTIISGKERYDEKFNKQTEVKQTFWQKIRKKVHI